MRNANMLGAMISAAIVVIGCGSTQIDGDCSVLDHNACMKSKHCDPIYGRPIDESRECLRDKEFAACFDNNLGCNAAIVYRRDPSLGETWRFPGCYPPDWEVVQDVGVDVLCSN